MWSTPDLSVLEHFQAHPASEQRFSQAMAEVDNLGTTPLALLSFQTLFRMLRDECKGVKNQRFARAMAEVDTLGARPT